MTWLVKKYNVTLRADKTISVGSFVISCVFFSKSKNSLDFERRHHKL